MKNKLSYEQTLEKIHSYLRFGSKLGLERMEALMAKLGNPQETLRVIHVAGTNGKGSVCRYLCAVLREHGYKAGLYTSPYLERFTERIEFDGKEISEADLCLCAEAAIAAAEEVKAERGESPTEFELVTAIAFLYFSWKAVDYVVLEVGMGGIGDSTNIVKKPLVSVITSISFDHMNYLGGTLAEIAANKAGIIKSGVPVVFSVKDEEASRVIAEQARKCQAEAVDCAAFLPSVQVEQETLTGNRFSVRLGEQYDHLETAMAGAHQVENAVVALAVIETLQKGNNISINKPELYRGFKHAFHPGRLEKISEKPLILIDGAHNEAGVDALCRALKKHLSGQKLLLIIGMLEDKEVSKMIRAFAETGASLMATEPDNPRKLSSAVLCEKVRSAGYPCEDGGDAGQALAYVKRHKEEWDGIIFAGSLYLIGKVRGGLTDGFGQAQEDAENSTTGQQ